MILLIDSGSTVKTAKQAAESEIKGIYESEIAVINQKFKKNLESYTNADLKLKQKASLTGRD